MADEATQDPVLRIRGLRKSFGALEVLKGISLEVNRHEVVGIIGPSGSGKSTLLRCINHLEKPTEGEVFLEGALVGGGAKAPGSVLAAQRADMAMVFQSFNLWPHKSTLENVTETLVTVRGKSREEANAIGRKMLAKVGMTEKADQYPSRLSGGQQQRVGIARALAMEPKVLLLDEPFAALNPQLRVPLRRELAQSCAEWGVPVVLVTHDVDDLLDLADEAVLIDEGRVLKHVNLRDASPDALAEAGLQPEPDTPERARRRALLA